MTAWQDANGNRRIAGEGAGRKGTSGKGGSRGGLHALREALRLWCADAWVRPFLTRYCKALFASIGLGVAALLFAVGLMFVSGFLVSDAAERPALGLYSLLAPLGLVQVFGIGKPFLTYRERLESHDWVLRTSSALRKRLFASVASEGTFWRATRKVGEMLGLLADDVDHVQNLYLRCIFPMVCAWALCVVTVAFFGAFSPLFALFVLFALSVLCLVLPLASALANAARSQRAKLCTRGLYEGLYDDTLGLADWNFAGRRNDYVSRVERLAAVRDGELDARRRSLQRFDLAVEVAFGGIVVAVLVWAAVHFGAVAQAAAGTGAAGRPLDWVAAFTIGFFPLLEAFSPLCDAAAGVGDHRESIERMNGLDAEGEAGVEGGFRNPFEARTVPCQPFDLGIEHLSFSYGNGAEVLHDINLNVQAGHKVALLGPSGCGKSTLLSLVRGYLAPTGGRVLLGQADVSQLGGRGHRYVSIVEQESYLFNCSIYDNLALGDASIGREQAARALAAVGLSPLVDALPAGMDTLVDEAGLNFSGGEAHRIALARVLLRDAPVVLLDEPTVGLDPPTERKLLETLFDVLADRTIVMATHHLACIERMDRVVFLDAGRIVLDGSPQDLARESERYRMLLAFDRGL